MSINTKIQWTDATWNPTSGCTKCSPGCANCYIERTPPMRMEGKKFKNGRIPLELHEDRLETPLKWRKPRRIFVNSMSDLFHEDVPDAYIDRVFATMSLCPQHKFQVLTKRSERMLAYFQEAIDNGETGLLMRWGAAAGELLDGPWIWDSANKKHRPTIERFISQTHCEPDENDEEVPTPAPWPLPNVWLGVSVENQAAADERLPLLLQTPASTRFLSVEPLLGPVDLSRWLPRWLFECPRCGFLGESDERPGNPCGNEEFDDGHCQGELMVSRPINRIDWVIVGGESGPRARPCRVEWIRDIVRQCRAAGVPVFVKQLGSNAQGDPRPDPVVMPGGGRTITVMQVVEIRDPKGGDPAEWPEDLRVREVPEP